MARSPLADLDLNLLVLLDALLEHGSTVKVARNLGKSQSAVSHGLGRLRDLFDDPLFERVGRTLVRTPLAESLEEPVRQLVRDAERLLERRPSFDPQQVERSFAIGVSDYIEQLLMTELLPKLHTEAPKIQIQSLNVGDAVDHATLDGSLDLAIRPGRTELAGLVQRRLYEDRLVGVMRADHPHPPSSLEDFLQARHILVSPRGLPGGIIDDRLQGMGHARTVVLRTSHFTTALTTAASTDLVTALPERYARTWADRWKLYCFDLPIELPNFSIFMVFGVVRRTDLAHQWLRNRIVEAFGAEDDPE